MSITHIEMAANTQEKFEFYFLSLVFTLLALSIQTSSFGNNIYSNSYELIGWMLLLVSGLCGLWRMEFVPVQHAKISQKQEIENQIIQFEKFRGQGAIEVPVLLTGGIEVIEETLANNRNALIILDEVIEKLEKHSLIKYKIHKFAFVAGLIFILLSRSFKPLQNILAILGLL